VGGHVRPSACFNSRTTGMNKNEIWYRCCAKAECLRTTPTNAVKQTRSGQYDVVRYSSGFGHQNAVPHPSAGVPR
jgi:hypothetical protein